LQPVTGTELSEVCGNLVKRKKVWIARFCEDVVGASGAIASVRRSAVLGSVTEIPTRRQAELLLAERLRSIDYGIQRPNSSRSLRDYAEAYWLPVVLPTLKHSTKKYYQYMLRVHLYPEFGNLQLRLITRDAVQAFFQRSCEAVCLGELSRVPGHYSER